MLASNVRSMQNPLELEPIKLTNWFFVYKANFTLTFSISFSLCFSIEICCKEFLFIRYAFCMWAGRHFFVECFSVYLNFCLFKMGTHCNCHTFVLFSVPNFHLLSHNSNRKWLRILRPTWFDPPVILLSVILMINKNVWNTLLYRLVSFIFCWFVSNISFKL